MTGICASGMSTPSLEYHSKVCNLQSGLAAVGMVRSTVAHTSASCQGNKLAAYKLHNTFNQFSGAISVCLCVLLLLRPQHLEKHIPEAASLAGAQHMTAPSTAAAADNNIRFSHTKASGSAQFWRMRLRSTERYSRSYALSTPVSLRLSAGPGSRLRTAADDLPLSLVCRAAAAGSSRARTSSCTYRLQMRSLQEFAVSAPWAYSNWQWSLY